MTAAKNLFFLLLFIVFSVNRFALVTAYANSDTADIVFVVDVSGSMNQADSGNYVQNALKLGIDLSPANSRVAIVSVHFEVVSATTLVDMNSAYGRSYLREFTEGLLNRGNTNFLPGYERAMEILHESPATHKRIIFLGDFDEGGFNVGNATREAETAALVDYLAVAAKERGVIIDSIMWRSPPNNSLIAPHFLALPQTTGGTLFIIEDSSLAPTVVEEIYLQNFEYEYSVLSVFGGNSQNISIPMPINAVRRARIFVSSETPPNEFGVNYAGGVLHGEYNRSYAMADIAYPYASGVNVTIAPGNTGFATIYTLFEFNPMELVLTIENDHSLPQPGELAIQTSTIRAELIDSSTGIPVSVYSYASNDIVQITSLNDTTSLDYYSLSPDTIVVHPSSPEDFGAHQINVHLNVGEFSFGPFAGVVDIPDVRPEIIPPEPSNWQLIAAIIVGITLILLSLVIFFAIRKKERIVPLEVIETKSDYRFHGKLNVCAIVVDGGNQEIRPFSFNLFNITAKKITLRDAFDSIAADERIYMELGNIILTSGPEESIIIRNNSYATIRVLGRNYYRRSKIQLFYDQKCYIVLERDVNELEISYKEVTKAQ